MINWKNVASLDVSKFLRFKQGAKIKVQQATGLDTEIDLDELAAINNLSATDLQKIDGITNGTAAANKALVLGDSKEIATITSATITTLTAPTVNAVNVDAGSSGASGTVDVFPGTATSGKLSITCADQAGDTAVTVTAEQMAAARTISLRDPGAAATLLTTTSTASGAVAATPAEITRACDVSARIVNVTTTPLAVVEATHENKVVTLNKADAVAVTLPDATGSGGRYQFTVGTTVTSGATTIKTSRAADIMAGTAFTTAVSGVASGFATAADSDTISFDGSTTGGIKGDLVTLVDAASGLWQVNVATSVTGTAATPFSATV